MTPEQFEDFKATTIRELTQRNAAPPHRDWTKIVSVAVAVAAVGWGVSTYVYMTRATATAEHTEITKQIDDHGVKEAHPMAAREIKALKKVQEAHQEILRAIDHNLIRIGERVKARGLRSGNGD